MNKTLTSALVALSLLVGGVAAAAGAQADVEPMRTGSTVWFNNIDDTPKTYDLRVTKVSGSQFSLSWQEQITNVASVCPKLGDHLHVIVWRNPEGTQGLTDVDECFHPGLVGLYDIGVQHI